MTVLTLYHTLLRNWLGVRRFNFNRDRLDKISKFYKYIELIKIKVEFKHFKTLSPNNHPIIAAIKEIYDEELRVGSVYKDTIELSLRGYNINYETFLPAPVKKWNDELIEKVIKNESIEDLFPIEFEITLGIRAIN